MLTSKNGTFLVKDVHGKHLVKVQLHGNTLPAIHSSFAQRNSNLKQRGYQSHSDWVLLEEKLRDDEWTEDCSTSGEVCDVSHTCVDRFDQHDIDGKTFTSGKHCLSTFQVTKECEERIAYQFTFEESDLETRDSKSYGYRNNIYCPNYDPTPRYFWNAERFTEWDIDAVCYSDSDCAADHICLK